ncbi:zinc-binding dehydrogenase [Nannocystis punicea]|uniref:Zinc-binding dehydrogenase n=1 Tax=Nannocystis punicea TaxID=2995304 RepID=A0ABY7HBY8_9BACT|nr:zinc-binding dehydrogenase [Nannocystis poenicansa]WAS96801.1 zinc-binding dehydrogenase [Nannocystis poenicansa]
MGLFRGAFAAREPAKTPANAERILAAVAAGQLRPHVEATLPFARAGEALTRMERREVLGKLVLVPEPDGACTDAVLLDMSLQSCPRRASRGAQSSAGRRPVGATRARAGAQGERERGGAGEHD